MDQTHGTLDYSESSTAVAQRISSALYPARLPEDAIRLLTVLPCDNFGAPVECELQQYHTSSAPDNEGLSYVWGDTSKKTAMVCNGLSVDVTISLRNALRRVRHRTEPTTIWADALCLNQADVEEKNVHVPPMGRTFSHAGNTVIYLGEASHEEAIAAAHGIAAVSDMLDDLRAQAGIAQDDFGDDFYDLLVCKLPTQISIDVSWNAVEILFNAAWFQRIWCVQEIVLACDTVRPSYAMYGHFRLQYRRVNQVGLCLSTAKRLCNLFAVDLNIPYCVEGVGQLSAIDPSNNSLLMYLRTLSGHRASDPRDMVYGLLGILLKHSDFDVASIAVDYVKPLPAVYTDVAHAIVWQDRNLRILDSTSYSKHGKYNSEFPSWVPRWNSLDNAHRWQDIHRLAESIRPRFRGSSRGPLTVPNGGWSLRSWSRLLTRRRRHSSATGRIQSIRASFKRGSMVLPWACLHSRTHGRYVLQIVVRSRQGYAAQDSTGKTYPHAE